MIWMLFVTVTKRKANNTTDSIQPQNTSEKGENKSILVRSVCAGILSSVRETRGEKRDERFTNNFNENMKLLQRGIAKVESNKVVKILQKNYTFNSDGLNSSRRCMNVMARLPQVTANLIQLSLHIADGETSIKEDKSAIRSRKCCE